jgi:hypothetical protein
MPPRFPSRLNPLRPGEARLFALAWAVGFLFFVVLLG